MKRLFIDIETSPNIVCSWRTGYKISIDEQNIIKERAIICICYKWEHEKTVKFLKWDDKQNDKKMVQAIVGVLNQADEIVGQNILDFDIAWIRTRAVFHNIITNPHYKIIDTLKFARRNMYFNSNKLDYLGNYMGFGGKIKTEFGLWKKILLENDKKALVLMIKYCQRDVILLEKVYQRLADHMPAHTHSGVLDGNDRWTCPKCSSSNVNLHLTRVSATGVLKRQFICRKCGRNYTVSDKVYRDYRETKQDDKNNDKKLKRAL
jgi:DNA polymerase III epsilon subunit-like protein